MGGFISLTDIGEYMFRRTGTKNLNLIMNKKMMASLLCFVATTAGANTLILAPEGSIESREGFLHGLSQDVIEDYADLKSAYDIDNYAEVNITDADLSKVIVAQVGKGGLSGNKVKVSVEGGDLNRVFIGQKGELNTAYVRQNGNGNTAVVGQLGRNNEALVVQDGDNNLAMVGQLNAFYSSNQISVEQTNDNNLAIVAGSGGANLGITQDGGDLFILETTSPLHIYVDQSN